MKKLFILPILLLGLLFVSCKKDDPTNDGEGTKYSELTLEQQKQKLADDGDEIVRMLFDLADAKVANVLETFVLLTEESEPDVSLVIDFEAAKFLVSDYNGEYTWNATTSTWDFKELEGKVAFNFPSTPEGKKNDARIEATAKGSGEIVTEDDVEYELPKEAKVVILLDNKQIASVESAIKGVNMENIAESVTAAATIDNYSFSFNAAREGKSKINAASKFSKGNDLIFDLTLASVVDMEFVEKADGYYEPQYDDNWNYIGSIWVEDGTYTDVEAEFGAQSVSLKIGKNLEIKGTAAAGKIIDELNALDAGENDDYWSKEYAEKEAAIYNKNATLVLTSVADKYKIASVKFVAINGVDEYYPEDYYATPFLVFADNTEAEVSAYFGEGFDKVLNSIEELLEKLGIYSEDNEADY